MAEVLAKREFQITGSRLSMITNSGGLGVLATDALIATGGQLATLSDATMARLNRLLPPEWSHQKPHRYSGGCRWRTLPENVADCCSRCQYRRSTGDFLPPQGAADPTDTAERLKDSIKPSAKTPPLTPSQFWLAGWVALKLWPQKLF